MNLRQTRNVARTPSCRFVTSYYAHSRAGEDQSTWEPLDRHLHAVAELARKLSGAFDSGEWGYLAGLWHDVGKYRQQFQDRIRGSGEKAEHAAAGAALAAEHRAMPAAFAIAGHHAGLANLAARNDTTRRPLRDTVLVGRPMLDLIRAAIPADIGRLVAPAPPAFLASVPAGDAAIRAQEMWTRFLFSALIDADRLATERFYSPDRRPDVCHFDSIGALRLRLDQHLSRFKPDSDVNRMRAEVLRQCVAAASQSTGLFSLTVPTGGGKTLSSLAFGLGHAETHGLRRVIVVIPYTSIIEQTAQVFAEAIGHDNVIEHHSAFDELHANENASERETRRRLAVENWDAPVIVTTTVQFFETLFSDHPSRCRKLHNVARSVVIIDEAQALPAPFLTCLLDGMKELVRGYGCTLLLSTATQPALGQRAALPDGLENVREIIGDPVVLAESLERVDVRWPASPAQPMPYDQVAGEMTAHERVLAIVHTRRDARRLAEMLTAEGRYHLSALMCASHRKEVLQTIKTTLLEHGTPCRLVATQLVEAGVDVDFPVVYRALGGLDSMAQAAGRCNREGMLRNAEGTPVRGEVVVFVAETDPPPGARAGLAVTRSLLGSHGPSLSISDQQHLSAYFRAYYQTQNRDAKSVMPERAALNFATVGSRMRLIDDGFSHPVAVPWGDGRKRIRELVDCIASGTSARLALRALQPFLVQVRERDLRTLQRLGAVLDIEGFCHQLALPFEHLYDPDFGLSIDDDAVPDVAVFQA